ncbi:MAG: FimV/HubP family polar landmark protein [Betaproteobacteria bacterium]
MRRSTTIAIAAVLLLAAPLAAFSAGLGRLTVLSALGQPLHAEIEIVSLQAGEEEGLLARLANAQAFAQAGIELNPALLGIRFEIERRDGRLRLKLTSVQPVNEPFLDMLVELQWNTGRLVREYTFLLDPPDYRARSQVAAVPAPAAKPAAPTQQALPAVEPKPAPAPAKPAIAAAPAAPKAPAQAGRTHEVKKGDTLAAIARQNLPPGVTLNQMLVAIYRANEEAFIRGNINLVRSGRILNIPGADEIGTIDRAEAEKLVRSHAEQWNDYRTKLAAVPARAEGGTPQREVTGRITEKPAAPPAAQKDELRLSKADPQKPASAAGRAAREDDAAARERALKEAQSREAGLQKNVADLQKLLALKNQQLAELEKKAAVAPAKPAPEAPKPAAAPTPPPAPLAEAPEAPKPPAEAAKPPPPAAKAPEAPKPAPKAPQKKAPEPGLLDEVLENPLMAFGGLALIVLLLGGYGYVAWRRKKQAHAKFQDSVLGAAAAGAAAGPSLAEPTTGGPAEPAAAEAAAAQAATPAGMDSEEVDPIAEADVYMAYGRDAQAEEILKEALQKDPNRSAVHSKLLEIYANRKDAKAFEQTALKLKGITNGAGAEWDKAAALGRSIDPGNGLYAGAGQPAAAPAAAAAAASPTIDFDLGGAAAPAASAPDISLDEPAKEGASAPLDFDLGGGAPAAPPAEPSKDFTADETVLSLDTKKEAESASSGLDFNLDLGGDEKKPEEAAAPAAKAAAAPASDSGGLDFDLNLDLGGADKPAEEKPAAPVDLSSISLDLGSPGGGDEDKTMLMPSMASTDPKWQEVATKLDLAKAYEEMGDKDGAKELLTEVMKDGDAAQKGQAQQLLAKLG